jgi:hypothetical protein
MATVATTWRARWVIHSEVTALMWAWREIDRDWPIIRLNSC